MPRPIIETTGSIKALLSPEDGRILGFTMVGAEAGEVMTVVQRAIQVKAGYKALRDIVINHPTMAESLNVFLDRETVTLACSYFRDWRILWLNL